MSPWQSVVSKPLRTIAVFFRFISAVLLVVLVSMGGVVIEKRILDLRRKVSKQQFRTDILLEKHATLRLRTQQLSAPSRMRRLDESLDVQPYVRGGLPSTELNAPSERLPLLNWQRQAPPRPYTRD